MIAATVTRLEGRAMGVGCAVTVTGAHGFDIARRSLARVSALESMWTRFDINSDIMRLNHSAGRAVFVDPLTVHLIEVMKAASSETQGVFDPTLVDVQVASGDGASRDGAGHTVLPDGPHSHDLNDVEIVDDFCVRMHNGVLLDAGGIGKGLAADIIAGEALGSGAEGICVNLGGDLRCAGTTPSAEGWNVAISSPFDFDRTISSIHLMDGAVATSSTLARRDVTRATTSHIMDPSLMAASSGPVAGATVIASSAAWAEVFTKVALLSHGGVTSITDRGLACLTVDSGGVMHPNMHWAAFAS